MHQASLPCTALAQGRKESFELRVRAARGLRGPPHHWPSRANCCIPDPQLLHACPAQLQHCAIRCLPPARPPACTSRVGVVQIPPPPAVAPAMAAQSFSQKMAFKIIVVGSMGVGKTCILERYVRGRYSKDHKATLGTGVNSKTLEVDGTQIVMQIYDTAGQERFDSLVNTYYRGSDAAIIVYDVTDMRTLEDVTAWHERLMKHVPRPEGFPVIVLGNKSDKPESAQQVSLEDGESFVAAKLPSASHLRVRAPGVSLLHCTFRQLALHAPSAPCPRRRVPRRTAMSRQPLRPSHGLPWLVAPPRRPRLRCRSRSKSMLLRKMAVAALADGAVVMHPFALTQHCAVSRLC